VALKQARTAQPWLGHPASEAPHGYHAEKVVHSFFEGSREHVAFERTLRLRMHLEIAGPVAD
jgi:hypothetical protein